MTIVRPKWPLLTTKEAAKRYSVKPQTVNRWVGEGLKPRGEWRGERVFDVRDVVRWLWKNRPNKRLPFFDAMWVSDRLDA